jgi:hypothetical protein
MRLFLCRIAAGTAIYCEVSGIRFHCRYAYSSGARTDADAVYLQWVGDKTAEEKKLMKLTAFK